MENADRKRGEQDGGMTNPDQTRDVAWNARLPIFMRAFEEHEVLYLK